MAKKAELLEQATELGLEVSEKNTIAEIEAAIAGVDSSTENTEATPEAESPQEETFAKAGKRSAKAAREAEEDAEKEERKAAIAAGELDDEIVEQKRGPVPVTRPRIERRGKKYQEAAKKIDTEKVYDLAEAVKAAQGSSTVKFDASVEIHIRLNVDPKQADQNIRGTVVLPNGTGKTQRVAVFAPADLHADAKKAGADIVGDDEFLALLDKETIEFDVLVATPEFMARLGKYARLLGPKGLMPSPKNGTVTKDISKAVTESKGGKIEYRVDAQGNVHNAVGKVSFDANKVKENLVVYIDAIKQAKPSSIKGEYILSSYLTTSMGPSVKVKV